MADSTPTPARTSLTPAELDEKVAGLSYEDARSRLVEIVTRLEQGNIPLEEALAMWELGEALARRCESWLDGARERLRAAQTHVSKSAPEDDDGTGDNDDSSGAGDVGADADDRHSESGGQCGSGGRGGSGDSASAARAAEARGTEEGSR